MKTIVMLLLTLAPTVVYAKSNNTQTECNLKPKPVVKKPKQVKKVVQKHKEVCCAEDDDIITSSQATTGSQNATTGNQVVNVTVPNTNSSNKVRVIERIQVRTKRVVKTVNTSNPNRILFLAGVSRTKLDIEGDCCNLTATKKHELDLGVQYIRDFGSFSGSVTGTMNQSFFIGLGVNW